MSRASGLLAMLIGSAVLPAAFGQAIDSQTTLAPSTEFELIESGLARLSRNSVTAVVVDNRSFDQAPAAGHRAGYSGLASLTHEKQARNLFVPTYAGLNFEHIHDGTTRERDILFEPRRAPMELRRVNQHTVELYQPPTPNWKLESALRYEMLPDGTIEMTFECIPRAKTFRKNYIGLFWASYIHQPESLDIHFWGHSAADKSPRWVRGVTPRHGVLATHPPSGSLWEPPHDVDFPLTLVFGRSQHVHDQHWYFGVSHGMALAMMFRPDDGIWLAQSPSGGGKGNPAWDFQWFIPDYRVNQLYRMRMRAMYLPFESAEQIEQATRRHRQQLSMTP